MGLRKGRKSERSVYGRAAHLGILTSVPVVENTLVMSFKMKSTYALRYSTITFEKLVATTKITSVKEFVYRNVNSSIIGWWPALLVVATFIYQIDNDV